MPTPKYAKAGNGEGPDDEHEGRNVGPSTPSSFRANRPTARSTLSQYLTPRTQLYEKFQAEFSELGDDLDDELAEAAAAAAGDESILSLSSPVPGAPLPANCPRSPGGGLAGARVDDDDDVLWYVDNYEASVSKERVGFFGPGGKVAALAQLQVVLRLGAPICVEKFSAFVPNFVLLVFYGRLGPDELAAGGFAFMFGNVTGVSLVVGFALGLPPLVAQAFGAGNHARCGELLQRQLLIHLAVVLPIVAALWLHAEPLLLAMGQPPAVVTLTATFLKWRLPGMPFLCVSESLGSFLKAQRIMVAPMLVVVGLNVGSVLLAALLVLPRGPLGAWSLGFVGGPIALAATNVATAATLVSQAPRWLREAGVAASWPRWSRRVACGGWREVLTLGLPAAAMMWGEWWAFETNLFLAGLLCGDPMPHSEGTNRTGNSDYRDSAPSCAQLDVSAVVANTVVLAYFCHSGFAWGAAAHVGNLLGAGDPATAKLACQVTLALVGCVSGTVALCLVVGRHRWGALFSDDPEVVDGVATLLPIVAGYVYLDAIGPSALNSLLRAVGVVQGPAAINLAAFYAVGIPLGVYLTFGPPAWGQTYGQGGLWVGLLAGVCCMVAGLGSTFARVDFAATAAKARAQALGDSGSGGSSGSDSGSDSGGGSSGSSGSSSIITGSSRSSGFNVLRDLEVAIEMADAFAGKRHTHTPLARRSHSPDSNNKGDGGGSKADKWSGGSEALQGNATVEGNSATDEGSSAMGAQGPQGGFDERARATLGRLQPVVLVAF